MTLGSVGRDDVRAKLNLLKRNKVGKGKRMETGEVAAKALVERSEMRLNRAPRMQWLFWRLLSQVTNTLE